ncbi:alanine racemase [Parendozoicomonas sp. Alg238-R29]|uniref:alanine racemase n=1 Tax=Parendozoicomonas sp. Alg238-R29 TaxID=2993446 RepID=UPI00248DAC0A|nr:alanine racemase [Parendozoicomonas sp. Alg238-R29]
MFVVGWVLLLSLVIGVFLILRNKNSSAPHNDYFSSLNRLLRQREPGYPVLLVDLDRVDHNIAMVKKHLGDTSRVRIAVKSLPCMSLIEYLMEKMGTQRVMAFHSPFALQMLRHFPKADLLIGKPFPVAVFTDFLERLEPQEIAEISRIQWLVDTCERLSEYCEVAKRKKLTLNISIEVDVGLHRGGVGNFQEFDRVLLLLAHNREHLKLAGLMGYDAHIAKAPAFPGTGDKAREKEKVKVAKRFRGFTTYLRHKWPSLWSGELCLNGAGSYTYQMNTANDWGGYNDITIGSAFMKASDFDIPSLADHKPALFIATRVLKKLDGLTIPYLEALKPLFSALCKQGKTSFFIYGGWWMASVCSPVGLKTNSVYGRSTNQELLTTHGFNGLEVDDYIFLLPSQSEFVMLQFGAIRALRGGAVVGEWPVLQQYPAREVDGCGE